MRPATRRRLKRDIAPIHNAKAQQARINSQQADIKTLKTQLETLRKKHPDGFLVKE